MSLAAPFSLVVHSLNRKMSSTQGPSWTLYVPASILLSLDWMWLSPLVTEWSSCGHLIYLVLDNSTAARCLIQHVADGSRGRLRDIVPHVRIPLVISFLLQDLVRSARITALEWVANAALTSDNVAQVQLGKLTAAGCKKELETLIHEAKGIASSLLAESPNAFSDWQQRHCLESNKQLGSVCLHLQQAFRSLFAIQVCFLVVLPDVCLDESASHVYVRLLTMSDLAGLVPKGVEDTSIRTLFCGPTIRTRSTHALVGLGEISSVFPHLTMQISLQAKAGDDFKDYTSRASVGGYKRRRDESATNTGRNGAKGVVPGESPSPKHVASGSGTNLLHALDAAVSANPKPKSAIITPSGAEKPTTDATPQVLCSSCRMYQPSSTSKMCSVDTGLCCNFVCLGCRKGEHEVVLCEVHRPRAATPDSECGDDGKSK